MDRNRAITPGSLNIFFLPAILFFVVIVGSACSSSPDLDEPPKIQYGEDVCDRCMMIINEARYATAYVTADGETRRFDDIGGMIRFDRDMNEDVAVYWVHDYDTEEWLKADSAFYVKDDNLRTPMGFGIIGFSNLERAERWADEEGGKLTTFSELWSASEDKDEPDQNHDS